MADLIRHLSGLFVKYIYFFLSTLVKQNAQRAVIAVHDAIIKMSPPVVNSASILVLLYGAGRIVGFVGIAERHLLDVLAAPLFGGAALAPGVGDGDVQEDKEQKQEPAESPGEADLREGMPEEFYGCAKFSSTLISSCFISLFSSTCCGIFFSLLNSTFNKTSLVLLNSTI